MNLDNPKYYINRELSWIEFNDRVLDEAISKSNPLLERLKFLSITGSNLDEFFMIRVAGLKEQVNIGYQKTDAAGMTAKEQLGAISSKVHKMVEKQYNCLNKSLFPKLKNEGIIFLEEDELTRTQKEFLNEYFTTTVFPVLTPMAIDQGRPFPQILNKSLNQAVILENEKKETMLAIVQVPSVLPRFVKLEDGTDENCLFIPLEKIIKMYIEKLFRGYKIISVNPFRLTRNADLSIDEEDAGDLLEEIEKSLRQREKGFPVRLELEKSASKLTREILFKMLNLSENELYEIDGPIDLSAFMKIATAKGFEHLKYEKFFPQPVSVFNEGKSSFEIIKKRDIFLHHPYQSFEPVLKFLEEAAEDPKVLAIKQSLYRVSGNSPIVKSLIKAAENGKQVTVLVELKARFDEENNIQWARKLEMAGCHVIYGLVGLKTHCKILLVVRQEEEGIKRYVHLSTGNYNDKTAKLYTDAAMFTSKESFGADASALFNVLTGYSKPPEWKKFSVAPIGMRETFIHYIENEIEHATNGREGRIIVKNNSLLDQEIIKALYKASRAGVKVDLIVRGICALRSGVKELSENINVYSIVGKYLEHSRIYYYENGGNPKIFLSSADWMPRNLDRRVETLFPVEDAEIKEEVKNILAIILSDNTKLRIQDQNGDYEQRKHQGIASIDSQSALAEFYTNIQNQKNDNSSDIKFKPKKAKYI
ncbi:MAG TPA: RNA degradosome polyphosphate kinase [Thermotogota bacterium]|nr:RNA degradosome polyphosphate kinase [Thermotogota bacterium]HPR94713.1 RNA degradosome polyphosphate kinase [Thermotogota bacterium]